ncbi:hypothetical protein [Hafnia paralvei]|uniref:hypothetical protein n=1 Tax=Hafnia paralvei TaxID=546367 RepID=UPI001CCFB83E|nr:hypothetical protein [Hafnia paralvei]UBM42004.1 hypothetical protein K9N75_06000 [Hafnia paralvei]
MSVCVMGLLVALNVTVMYRVDGDMRVFSETITSSMVIERYLKLECGDTIGLFVPVGKGKQVNAQCIEWFEIERVKAPKE